METAGFGLELGLAGFGLELGPAGLGWGLGPAGLGWGPELAGLGLVAERHTFRLTHRVFLRRPIEVATQ